MGEKQTLEEKVEAYSIFLFLFSKVPFQKNGNSDLFFEVTELWKYSHSRALFKSVF